MFLLQRFLLVGFRPREKAFISNVTVPLKNYYCLKLMANQGQYFLMLEQMVTL
jgi:hypothetical protein